MKKKNKPDKRLVGTWASCDPTQSSVRECISVSKGRFVVTAFDADDGEHAEVRDVGWDGVYLRYNLHWPSTGRFTKNTLTLLAKNRVGLTYMYSGQEVLERQADKGKPNQVSQRIAH